LTAGVYELSINSPGGAFNSLFVKFTVVNSQVSTTVFAPQTLTEVVTPTSLFTSISTTTETAFTTLPPVTITSPAAKSGTLVIHPTTVISVTDIISRTFTTEKIVSTTETRTLPSHCTFAKRGLSKRDDPDELTKQKYILQIVLSEEVLSSSSN
ncbi:hypothetical protein BDK51DRAFT_26161, partial [Blyttiomyces helicus]